MTKLCYEQQYGESHKGKADRSIHTIGFHCHKAEKVDGILSGDLWSRGSRAGRAIRCTEHPDICAYVT